MHTHSHKTYTQTRTHAHAHTHTYSRVEVCAQTVRRVKLRSACLCLCRFRWRRQVESKIHDFNDFPTVTPVSVSIARSNLMNEQTPFIVIGCFTAFVSALSEAPWVSKHPPFFCPRGSQSTSYLRDFPGSVLLDNYFHYNDTNYANGNFKQRTGKRWGESETLRHVPALPCLFSRYDLIRYKRLGWIKTWTIRRQRITRQSQCR